MFPNFYIPGGRIWCAGDYVPKLSTQTIDYAQPPEADTDLVYPVNAGVAYQFFGVIFYKMNPYVGSPRIVIRQRVPTGTYYCARGIGNGFNQTSFPIDAADPASQTGYFRSSSVAADEISKGWRGLGFGVSGQIGSIAFRGHLKPVINGVFGWEYELPESSASSKLDILGDPSAEQSFMLVQEL